MLRTSYLNSAAGIQYQGVKDNSMVNSGQAGVVGVIVGFFKRGQTNQVFEVTADNYRARLGHDPDNKFYLAVQDLFKTGFPVVRIQRLVAGA